MLRAVLDTNVIISGTIQGSSSAGAILKAWQEGRFLLVTSETLILEARRVFKEATSLSWNEDHYSARIFQSALNTQNVPCPSF